MDGRSDLSLQEWEGSNSDWNGPAWVARSGKSNKIHSAAASSRSTGRTPTVRSSTSAKPERQLSLLSTSSAEDSPAKTSPQLETERGSPVSKAVSGSRCSASSKSSSRGSSSPKTWRRFCLAGWTRLLVDSHGAVTCSMCESFPRATSELRTSESESSLWPTALASDGTAGAKTRTDGYAGGYTGGYTGLKAAVEKRPVWPTTTASDAKGSRRATAKTEDWTSHDGTTLLDAVMTWPTPVAMDRMRGEVTTPPKPGQTRSLSHAAMFPTPTAASYGTRNNGDPGDGRGEYKTRGAPSLETMGRTGALYPTPTAAIGTGGQTSRSGDRKDELLLAGMVGGRLNPTWVEVLMGFPEGWTDGPADPETLPLFGNPLE